MPIHLSSSGDYGLLLYNGGSTPIGFRELYIYEGGWIQLSQLWRCTAANPGTSTYTWQQFCTFDKYKPTVAPVSCSLSQGRGAGAPLRFAYADETTTGITYGLYFILVNTTQGISGYNAGNLAYGRASSGALTGIAVPSGWNSGDTIWGYTQYQDANGYAGPQTNAASITLN